MQGIAIKIFVHDCQARESEWIRGVVGVGKHFQDLFHVQLNKYTLSSYLVCIQWPLPEHCHSCH